MSVLAEGGKAHQTLDGDSEANEEQIFSNEQIKVTFLSPQPSYYDGYFSTPFESCIKDRFVGLDTINRLPSSYVRDGLNLDYLGNPKH